MEKLKKIMIVVFVTGILIMPTVSIAGSLEPSGPPAPTMKTLDQIPPTWSQKLPTAAERFEVIFDGYGVLDKETGLVWDRYGDQGTYDWISANNRCMSLPTGWRLGWHLPTKEQLASLVDKTVANPPHLMLGHPFMNQANEPYWTASTTFGGDYAYVVGFDSGVISGGNKSSYYRVRCVRGGQTYDSPY